MLEAVAPAYPPSPDLLALPAPGDDEIAAALAAGSFDARMRAAFAVLIVAASLPVDLRGTFTGEIATRCRQAGVACHLICAPPAPDAFAARIYDLQTVHAIDAADELPATARLVRTLL